MIAITNKEDCCGCSACMQICPQRCIKLVEDEEGFPYPNVNQALCTNCNICTRVCPQLSAKKSVSPNGVYAGFNTDDNIRIQSSSGGIFSIIAEYIIKQGGVIFGATFNDKWEVTHNHTDSISELEKFRGSKYVQSSINSSYKNAESFLKQNRIVLFSGTPCQIAGLHSYLRKSYDNLITVDFICHGVPSPGVFRTYLKETYKNKKIIKINFRDKKSGWKNYSFSVGYSNNSVQWPMCISSEIFYKNSYMQGFLRNLFLRPSCYKCTFKQGRSGSDITIGDLWGLDIMKPYVDDDKGCSLIITNSAKADTLLHRLVHNLHSINLEDAATFNPSISNSVSIPFNRNLFYSFSKHLSITHSIKLCMIVSKIRKIIKNII